MRALTCVSAAAGLIPSHAAMKLHAPLSCSALLAPRILELPRHAMTHRFFLLAQRVLPLFNSASSSSRDHPFQTKHKS